VNSRCGNPAFVWGTCERAPFACERHPKTCVHAFVDAIVNGVILLSYLSGFRWNCILACARRARAKTRRPSLTSTTLAGQSATTLTTALPATTIGAIDRCRCEQVGA
jgi:hypothetical protein